MVQWHEVWLWWLMSLLHWLIKRLTWVLLKNTLYCFGKPGTQSQLYLLDHFSGLHSSVNGCGYIPDLGLLLGLGGGYDAGLPTSLLFESRFAVSFVLAVAVALVLRGGAGEALGAHDSGDVLLPALSGFSDGLRYYPVGLLLLVLYVRLHLMVRPPRRSLLRRGAGRGRRRWGRGGGRRAALHWGTEDPYLATGTISVLSRLRKAKRAMISMYQLWGKYLRHDVIYFRRHKPKIRCWAVCAIERLSETYRDDTWP